VDKVASYSGDAATLTREDVEAVMSTTAATSVFDFLDAVGGRDCRTALRLLADLLGEGEQLLGVHAMSLRHVRNLLSVRSLLDRGMPLAAIAEELGMREWQTRNLVRQAGRFEQEDLVRALTEAAETERRMKTSQDPRLAFERWLVSICGSGAG
jgi:DNA polymerase III delta subunit